jgi:DNA-binding HxlR family transcriptional regulator
VPRYRLARKWQANAWNVSLPIVKGKKRRQLSKGTKQRSCCPIACALDTLGDKWSLLVVRDMLLLNKRLYSELAQSEEGIPTNILAARLRRLENAGIITKAPYQRNPVRYAYELTPAGRELEPLLHQYMVWGSRHVPYANAPPKAVLQGKVSLADFLSRVVASRKRSKAVA